MDHNLVSWLLWRYLSVWSVWLIMLRKFVYFPTNLVWFLFCSFPLPLFYASLFVCSGVDLGTVKMSLNPFCEIAVEEAIRLKEKKIAREVVAGKLHQPLFLLPFHDSITFQYLFVGIENSFWTVTVGPKSSQEVLRTALAMGADRAIHVQSDKRLDQELQPMAVARTFEKLAKKEGCLNIYSCCNSKISLVFNLIHDFNVYRRCRFDHSWKAVNRWRQLCYRANVGSFPRLATVHLCC